MRELESVESLAHLANESAIAIELEEPRVGAPRVHEDVSLRIRGDADTFTEIEIRRQLQEIGDRPIRDLGDVLRLGLVLRGDRSNERKDNDHRPQSPILHRPESYSTAEGNAIRTGCGIRDQRLGIRDWNGHC